MTSKSAKHSGAEMVNASEGVRTDVAPDPAQTGAPNSPERTAAIRLIVGRILVDHADTFRRLSEED